MNRRRIVVQSLGLGAAWPLLRAHAAVPCPPSLLSAQGGTSSAASCGQPIAGALVHGQAFHVTGSGFGARADYNVGNYTWQGHRHIHFRFGDLAGGFPANRSSKEVFTAALKGFFPAALFEFNGDYQSLSLSIENGGPSRSGKFLRKVGTGFASPGYLEILTDSNSAIPSHPNAYSSYKFRGLGNGKIFRWRSEGSNSKNFYVGNGATIRESEWPYTSCFYSGEFPRSATVWSRHEVVMSVSPGSQLRVNGTAIRHQPYIDGVGQPVVSRLPLVNAIDSSRNLAVTWPNSVDPGATFEFADIYYDFTAARVEVSDGQRAEIQILTAWSPTQIACVFNKGELRSGAGTVRVYDANDNVIHSAPIVIA